jgi:beta-glucosidase
VQAGQVPEARLDDMVTRILTARIAEGQLGGRSTGSQDAVVTSPAHQRFARRLSEQGIVLLKNGGGVLPLGHRVRSIAVIGAAAQTAAIYTGGGSASVVPSSRSRRFRESRRAPS